MAAAAVLPPQRSAGLAVLLLRLQALRGDRGLLLAQLLALDFHLHWEVPAAGLGVGGVQAMAVRQGLVDQMLALPAAAAQV